MVEERIGPADLGFIALATLPGILVWGVATMLDRASKMPVAWFGVGLGVLLAAVGMWLIRGAAGRRRALFCFFTALAALPFALFAVGISLQWIAYFVFSLF